MKNRYLLVILLLAIIALLWQVSGDHLLASTLFTPNAASQPDDVACRPHAGKANRLRVEWTDTNDGGAEYHIYRKAVSDNSYGDPIATVTDPNSNGLWRWVDENAGDGTFQYRVTADDGNDETTPGADQTCREPLLLDSAQGNYRVYYRLQDCPDYEGKSTCTENINVDSQNKHAKQVLDDTEAYRTELMDMGFNDPSFFNDEKPFPLDFFPCNNGCANGDGIQYPPANFEGTDYDPATGNGSDYEVFVVGHEVFHKIQGAHGGGGADPFYKWLIEGQARSTEDKMCIFSSNAHCEIWDEQVDQYYLGQVNAYLGAPEKTLMEHSYNAALFWTYVTEQFAQSMTTEPRYGMDVLVSYWEQNEENKANDNAKDGIDTLNDTLANKLGSDRRFKDIFQDFAVANYGKDLITNPVSAQDRLYNYIDEENCGTCAYNMVKRTIQDTLDPDETLLGTHSVDSWGARYFEIDLNPAVPSVHIEVDTLPGTPHALYYHVLAIKNGAIQEHWSNSGDSFELSVFNIDPVYDRLALIVVGLEQNTNFNWGFNLSDGLFISTPNAQFQALAGDPASPKKFMIQLEVIGADQQPLAGIDVADFGINVGNITVNPPANAGDNAIVSSTYNAGKYWIVLRAPDNPGCDPCDLTVSYGPYTDTETNAIDYGLVPSTDNIMVIDRSGSMEGAKIQAAQNAASLYVDAYDTGDRIGVVSFNDTATTEYAINNWTNTTRVQAQDAIQNLDAPEGGTANGAGLRQGMDLLIAQDSPNPVWSMVLLSDGQDTTPEEDDQIPAFLTEYNARKDAGDSVPVIHVVAVGDDADGVALESVTAAANGLFQWLPEESGLSAANVNAANVTLEPNAVNEVVLPLDLSEIYRVFAESVTGEQQIYAKKGFIDNAESDTHPFHVDGGASQLVIALPFVYTVPGIFLDIDIFRPDDTKLGPPTLTDSRHLLWRVPAPMAGQWRVVVGPNIPGVVAAGVEGDEKLRTDYLVEASLISDLTMEVFLGLSVEERIAGKAMPLLVALTDTGPLTGATVQATVERTGETLTLFDDGLHGDGAAGDGFYGGLIKQTQQAGGYSVVVDASGNSDLFGEYDRRARVSFFMQQAPDSDRDGVPDPLEGDCMDPNASDANLDHDGDGIPSGREVILQFDPCDPDTDDGGESDGSEFGRGQDPLNPSDDFNQPPRLKAWPGAGKVFVYASTSSVSPNLTIYRSNSPDGPFSQIVDGQTAGVWEDTTVSNGTLYCYRAIAAGRATSAPSNVSCATPNTDPHAPHGFIELPIGIVEPVPATTMLHLDAEDNPETEEHMPFDGALLDRNAIKTGVVEMQLSNQGDFEGAEWEPYSIIKEWTLAPNANGIATVYVQYRDAAGNISDVVTLTVQVDPNAGNSDELVPTLFLPFVTG
ncbi:MAG: VWA domain-containing protein [Chloroflexota bacterium]